MRRNFQNNLVNEITYVEVDSWQQGLAINGIQLYGNPVQEFKTRWVTGTNGKTTVSSLLYQLFKKAGC